ncbi:protein kinase-like protein [Beauveria brongniartii RCEF 3172]|uniref:Protein kinase-like protein n=1 Tax=Beauveria brongniartii RCEF 3172 TaxID=1081107 RepID=A0A162JZ52_9HYPO|nr:protein kinase-like protein [Beauveria brongniartii RCEF 3172]
MPLVYRDPEVILGMEWSSNVDIWSVGVLVWDLLEGKRLLLTKNDGTNDDEQHLAEMVAFIGPRLWNFCKEVRDALAISMNPVIGGGLFQFRRRLWKSA